MLDLVGKVLIELRDDAEVDAIVDGRVRVFEPAPGDAAWTTDANGNRQYAHPFIVISTLATPRAKRVPIQRPRYAIRCYGTTQQQAMALYVAASDALHENGPRVHANGAGIYRSFDDLGGTQEKDPDTSQPVVTFITELIATTQAVA